MAAGAPVSVEEYLKSSFNPNSEYVEGRVRPKSLPTKLHSLLEFMITVSLRQQGVEALAELTVRLSATKYLIPDVVAAESLGEPYPTEPAMLCVEILSPEDRLGAMFAKCEDYHAWGVPYCWVIDPVKQTGWQYDAQGEPVKVEPGGTLHAGKLAVNLGELFTRQA